ncbi:uncharacterized protein LOC101993990 isoform X1 [Microtus ochrogaster]|uniref:Uncharacterized protein LOC101993990 isoform X1 n=1 Tax=Microtus ochrogaster TaxID=79684 RepID=A0ABM1AYV6_MICOH|nr:uncharacterized protein LOC101993990 isoform X1 [Microtus ochrogaster]
MKIDLEVSEPVNYSSGDHKYLVQKAAIKGVRSNPEQPFTYSSRDTPQEAIKYPHPKSRDGANTYAVQISEDVTPDESTTAAPSPFEDMSVRRGFIVKVFIILSVQLLCTMVIISIFVFCKPVRKWIIGIPWFMYALFPAVLVVIIVLACCRDIRRQVPANYILLALFFLQSGRDTMGSGSNHSGDLSAYFICSTNKMGFYHAKWSDVCFPRCAYDLRDYRTRCTIILVTSDIFSTWNTDLLHVPGNGRADDGWGALPL